MVAVPGIQSALDNARLSESPSVVQYRKAIARDKEQRAHDCISAAKLILNEYSATPPASAKAGATENPRSKNGYQRRLLTSHPPCRSVWYQYALLSLSNTPPYNHPGLTVLDMPAEPPDVELSDLDNFAIEPFAKLLDSERMTGCQAIVAGSSFRGLSGANKIELTHLFA